MRSWKRIIVLAVVLVIIAGSGAGAGEFYLHEQKDYWWYYVGTPGFYAVIPSNAERYYKKAVFGYEFLEILWEKENVVMEIGAIPNSTVTNAINFVAKRWSPFLKNETVLANREITTSNNLKAYFYAVEGTGPDAVKYMLRSVYFTKEGTVVYLAMYLPSGKYTGTMLNHWIKAVNESEWE